MFFILYAIHAAAILHLCAPRRGRGRPTMPQHIQDYVDEYVKERGDLEYDPNHGYQPYWADGDWVFMEPKPKPKATTTPEPTLVCGNECPYIYRKVKHVCGRRSNILHFKGCRAYIFGFNYCRGYKIDDYTGTFYTFDTYCEFLDAQCRSPEHNKWMFLHSGKCLPEVGRYLKPISQGHQLVNRVKHYYTQLSNARASHKLPPISFS